MSLKDADKWSVPEHTVTQFASKGSKYCVCIPVINEGERIRNQLNKMKVAGIDQLADIIICDGGSSDNSLDPEFLKACGISVLLIKTGPGIVGAQLRMGYAYALKQGYQGIITMDGNDKDHVDVVSRFIEKLEQGYDLVQGSRYAPGGRGINTPRLRHLGIKLIHTPVINFISGYKYTDTTNGNRGYSDKLLLSERIQPFRDIFYHYEFLVFVSSTAPRIGFKVTEVPMTREYPPGKVPTKITFFRGNWRILKSLWGVVTRSYNP
ncbi:MAG: glycosyltransferase family 2 protein [Pseudomonadota bacterium]|jgi:dolichol-phosphate mannosyltransferase